jgi:DNA polymerase/3'-5' exonuclease PolX
LSGGAYVTFPEAYKLAEQVSRELAPHVDRIKAVGSLRRRRSRVGDIEFLVEPKQVAVDLFGTLKADIDPIRAELHQLGTWVKGGDRMMQITDLLGRAGLHLEVYLVHPPAQWGSLLAIRTGPRDLGHEAVTRMRENGLRHIEGRVMRGTETIPTPTEEDFFRLAGLDCVPPHERDVYAGQLNQARERANAARYSHFSRR